MVTINLFPSHITPPSHQTSSAETLHTCTFSNSFKKATFIHITQPHSNYSVKIGLLDKKKRGWRLRMTIMNHLSCAFIELLTKSRSINSLKYIISDMVNAIDEVKAQLRMSSCKKTRSAVTVKSY